MSTNKPATFNCVEKIHADEPFRVTVEEPNTVTNVPVKAFDEHGPSAVRIGDVLYSSGQGGLITELSKHGNVKFAVAQWEVEAGKTATIAVRVIYTRGLEPGEYMQHPDGKLVSLDGRKTYANRNIAPRHIQ